MSEHEDGRAAGMAKMQEVYGLTADPAAFRGGHTDVSPTTSSGRSGSTTATRTSRSLLRAARPAAGS